jgi:hypothetical protein
MPALTAMFEHHPGNLACYVKKNANSETAA